MKIGFFELEGWEEKIIKENLSEGHEIYFFKDKILPSSLFNQADLDVISIFIDSRITKDVLDNFPNLKFITTRSTGFDHIDIKACKGKGILVAYVPGYGDNTVAEFTFGFILNLTRKMYNAIDQVKENGSFSLKGLRGTDIKGKTIGVIGTGRIGKEVIKIAQGFGMSILAFDPFPDVKFQQEFGLKYVSLKDLLKNSDVISIHCPYNAKTHHLLNKDNIHLIKKGAYLINTARGGIVETEALIEALQQKILSGAGIDVLEEEGEIKDELNFVTNIHPREEELKTMLYDHILMKMPNVLITPHNAFNSQEALERILNTTIENIKGFSRDLPINLVR